MTVLHDFTQSRADLIASMKTHVTDIDFRALANQLNGGTMAAEDGFAKTLGALSEVASSVRGIPGHKNVIWVGTGFDHAYDLTSASDSDAKKIADALELCHAAHAGGADCRCQRWTRRAWMRSRRWRIMPTRRRPGGGPNSSTEFAQDASFDELARSTGGTVVHGLNDLDRLVTRDAERAADFYTLAYVPVGSSSAAQPYRRIRVVMKDPNLVAVTRTGYYAGPAAEAPVTPSNPKTQSREFKFDLLSAGGSRMVYTGLHVSLVKAGDVYHVVVEAGDLQWKPDEDGQLAEVSIVGVVFNAKDKVLGQEAQEFKERIGVTVVPQGKQVNFKMPLAVAAGAVRVRFVVRDAGTGRMGSVEVKP